MTKKRGALSKVTTSITFRRRVLAALRAITLEEQEKREEGQFGMGEIVEEGIELWFKARGLNVEEYARKEGA